MQVQRIYALLKERLAQGPAATATVVRVKGSTPREVGAKMVVQGERCWGTIGGGCGEGEVVDLARRMLSEGGPRRRLVRIDLTERALETSDRICGGIMEILVELFDGTEVAAGLWDGTARIRAVPLGDGRAALWGPGVSDPPELREAFRETWSTRRSLLRTVEVQGQPEERFFELLGSPHTLVICGAGHIAQPLASMAHLLDLKVVVIDDRPEYATSERFADADDVIARPFADALRGLELEEECSAVLVTRGHRHDELCLRELLPTRVSYIGMLGSRRRVRAIFDSLREEGYAPEQLRRVWAPVGLDIGASTPAEIALCILAEIVALRQGAGDSHPHLRRNPANW